MNKITKQLLTGVVALGLLAPVATSSLNPINTVNVNAKRHHKRSKWHYLRHRDKEFRNGRPVSNYWANSKKHWVLVKHNVHVRNISIENTDNANPYSIGTRILKKGSIVKVYYTSTSPRGFHILKSAKGFHFNKRYEYRHAATWTVYPGGHPHHRLYINYWMRAVK